MVQYKWLLPDGSRNGYCYPLPHDGLPGEWTPEIVDIGMCRSGYHTCSDPFAFLSYGPRLFVAEGRGKSIGPDNDGKTVWSSVRLLREVPITEMDLRLLACDYAEHVLPLFETKYPEDKRPRTAIETARKYVKGEASLEELQAACSAVACSAAAHAAAYAADAAAYAADAYSAAAAAHSAAHSAARTKARGEEKGWQREKLRDLIELRSREVMGEVK